MRSLLPSPYRRSPNDPLIAFHSGNVPLTIHEVRLGLHLGTVSQALMRGGDCLDMITISPAKHTRFRDRAENQWRTARLIRAAQAGFGIALYLNRHEGVSLDEVEEARRHPNVQSNELSVDGISDALFRRLVPSARDSILLLDPSLIVSIEPVQLAKPAGPLPTSYWATAPSQALSALRSTGLLPVPLASQPALTGLLLYHSRDNAEAAAGSDPIFQLSPSMLRTLQRPIIRHFGVSQAPASLLPSDDWTITSPVVSGIETAILPD